MSFIIDWEKRAVPKTVAQMKFDDDAENKSDYEDMTCVLLDSEYVVIASSLRAIIP